MKNRFFLLALIVSLLLYFSPIWKSHLIPFPGRLLVSFFSPWKEEVWPGYPAGVPRKGILGYDTVRMMGPWRRLVTDELLRGKLPTWNPHQFAGAPMLANGQTGVWFPLHWIYLLLPFPVSWTILVVLQPTIAAISMWLLLRTLGYRGFIAGIFSLMYAFSSWMSVWVEWNIHGFVYAFMPLGLYAVHQKKLLLGVGIASLIVFSGHPQMALIGFSAMILYGLLSHRAVYMVVVFASALVVTSVQWIPTVRYLQFANRERHSKEFSYEQRLVTWRELAQILAPNINGNPATENYSGEKDFVETSAYVGIATLWLAVVAIMNSRKIIYPFLLIAAVFILITPNPVSLAIGKFHIPILSTSVPSRWLVLWPLACVLLAARGMECFLRKKADHIFVLAGTIVFLLALLWFWALSGSESMYLVARRNLVMSTGISIFFVLNSIVAAGFLKRIRQLQNRQNFLLIIFLASFSELLLFGWKTMPFTESNFIYPDVPILMKLKELSADFSRFANFEENVVDSNFATWYGVYDLSGYDALYPRRIGELVWAASNGGIVPSDFSRSTASVPIINSPERNRLLNLAGVRWVLYKDEFLSTRPGQNFLKFPPDRFRLVFEKNKLQIYENMEALPRAFFLSDFSWIGEGDEMIKRIYTNPLPSISVATLRRYDPTIVNIDVEAPEDGFLVLTDTLYPGWKALVDHRETKILSAFHAFRAVPVRKGRHQVKFTYSTL